jgi:glyoxylase-like metal-dependent hydrolase (beta-lactamase superfamily II)
MLMDNYYNGFYRIEIPIPVPLKTVNCYLAKSSLGWHIIDTGFNTEEAKLAWKNAFKSFHISPQDIVEIVLTHFHPDHVGLAGWLQEYTKAPVKISSESQRKIQNLWIDRKEPELFDQFSYEHGMNNSSRNKVLEYLKEFPKYVYPMPDFTTFEEGQRFYWHDEYQAIHTPGHADGHMIFYSPTSKTVVAGDLLLPKITPNISYFPGFNANPLKAFFDSLKKIQQYQLDTVLPGHRDVYQNGNKRANELMNHHHERLKEIIIHLQKSDTAVELSWKLFPFLSGDSEPLQLLFALQETLAHLIFLEEKGVIYTDKSSDGIFTFTLDHSKVEVFNQS